MARNAAVPSRMLIIPAIDLKDGRCVRLKQGVMEQATVFSEDPGAMARHWVGMGARRLHLVDLNGAFAGRPRNEAAVKASNTAASLARVRYENGASDFLQVLDAERTLLESEDRLARSRTEAATSLIAVYKSLGGGWRGATSPN